MWTLLLNIVSCSILLVAIELAICTTLKKKVAREMCHLLNSCIAVSLYYTVEIKLLAPNNCEFSFHFHNVYYSGSFAAFYLP